MVEKGCVFEFSEVLDEWCNYLYSVADHSMSKTTADKLSTEMLGISIEESLNRCLSETFRVRDNVLERYARLMEEAFDSRDISYDYLEEVSYEVDRIIHSRIIDKFSDLDMEYALWNVKKLSSYIYAIVYMGDFRIIEWHERNGIPYKDETTVQYEFDLSFLYNLLEFSFAPFRGKYAGPYFNKLSHMLIRNIVDDTIFSEHDVGVGGLDRTMDTIEEMFPLMTRSDIGFILVDITTAVDNNLRDIVMSTVNMDDVSSSSIVDNRLIIKVNSVMTRVSFEDRLKDELKESLVNGDYIPKRLRKLIDL